jgi:AcrR family transcriptional regulator
MEAGAVTDEPDKSNKNVARGEATRAQLIAIGTRLFAARGYEGTSIEAVLQEAGVSRGSLYHHFSSKEALFEAVLEDVAARASAQTVEAAQGAETPVEALRAASMAWIRTAGDPVVQRILLIDALSVIGWERWRAMDEGPLSMIKAVIQTVADDGKLRPELVDTLAHVVLASVNEVALLVALSDDQAASMAQGTDAVDEFLRRLLG